MTNLLADFATKEDWARAHNITKRTADKYRAKGLPWVRFGGRIWIGPTDAARRWLLANVRQTTGGDERRST